MNKNRFGFLSLGLIGGSIALAIRQICPDAHIVAYARRQSTLDEALAAGAIDEGTTQINELFSDCDMIFLCAPVAVNNTFLEQLKPVLSDKTIITDVGSVKGSIHETVTKLGLDSHFIGGHPMAGSERTGFANSKASLLENAYYILTPTPSVPAEKLDAYRGLVTAMGAIPLVLDYRKHDYVTAAISHLPHVIAAALVNLIRDSDSEEGIMKMVAAGGFKDITRIASSSPAMWQQICLSNRENISALLSDYIRALTAFQAKLDKCDKNALYDEFDSARVYRDSFINASSGPIKRSYRIYVDIADKAGSLAQVTALLADNNLSIKNVGITHNRESEDGVLTVEFYEEASMTTAADVLAGSGFSVNIRP